MVKYAFQVHRVVFPKGKEERTRNCIVIGFVPDDDTVISCIDGSAMYDPIKTVDLFNQRMKEFYDRDPDFFPK